MDKILKNKGITIISLIVTIVIIIILATISIMMIIGENGLLNMAKLAKQKSLNAQKQEDETLGEYEELISKITGSRDENVTINVNDLKSLVSQMVKDEVNNANGTPTGSILAQMGNNAPEGYLFCDGKEYNINDYKNLAEYINNQFGRYNYFGGDGTSTFAVPNLQGEFLRGYSKVSTASVTSGVITTDIGKNQAPSLLPNWTYGTDCINYPQSDNYKIQNVDVCLRNTGTRNWINRGSGGNGGLDLVAIRPTNTSVLYCIKY